MPATDTERLVVSLEARIRDFEKNFQKANRTAGSNFNQIERRAKRSADQLQQSMGGMGRGVELAMTGLKAGLAGLAAGGSLAAIKGIASAVNDATKSVLEMSDSAKIAGVSFKSWQELKFVADQNRISVDALQDGLKELSLRADEFIQTGSGSGAEAFQRLGYNAEQLKEKLKEPNELFIEIIGRLGQLDKAAQIRIADEVFGGTGGETFVKLIEQGEAGIRAQIKAANDLGLVMDEKMIAKAEEVNQKFNALASTIGTRLKSAIVDAVSALADFIDRYRAFEDQKTKTLQERQSEIGLKRLDLEAERAQIQNGESSNPLYWNKEGAFAKGRLHEIALELGKLAEEERQIVAEQAKRLQVLNSTPTKSWVPPTPPPGGFGAVKSGGKVDLLQFLAPGKDAAHVTGMDSGFAGKLEKMFAALPKELAGQITINSGFRSTERQAQLWAEALAKYGSVAEARKWVAPPGKSQHNEGEAADLGYKSDAARQWAHDNASKFGLSFPLSNENWHIEDAGARGKMLADKTKELESRGRAYDDLLTKARQFVTEQGMEQQAFGLTAQKAAALKYEQQMLNEAQRSGITLTPQQRAAITGLAQDMAAAEHATISLANSQEQAQDVANFFASSTGDAIMGLINGSKTAEQAIQGLIASIAQALLQAALLGEGPLGSLMGGGGGLLGSFFKAIIPGAAVAAKDGGEIQAFARGGRVRGPGTSRSDSVPAWLSDGEHVINADAAGKNRALLEAVNAGRTPKLAKLKLGGGGSRSMTSVVNTFSPTIPITVQASGNKETDDALASRLSAEMDTILEAKMVEFVKTQQRPGNMLNQRGFI